MFFERKAFIEFVDETTIKITTPFKQKQFDVSKLKKEDTLSIDLIDLVILGGTKTVNFYATITHVSKPDRFLVEVYADKSDIGLLGAFDFFDREKFFKIKILEA